MKQPIKGSSSAITLLAGLALLGLVRQTTAWASNGPPIRPVTRVSISTTGEPANTDRGLPPPTGEWFIRGENGDTTRIAWGGPGDQPVAAPFANRFGM